MVRIGPAGRADRRMDDEQHAAGGVMVRPTAAWGAARTPGCHPCFKQRGPVAALHARHRCRRSRSPVRGTLLMPPARRPGHVRVAAYARAPPARFACSWCSSRAKAIAGRLELEGGCSSCTRRSTRAPAALCFRPGSCECGPLQRLSVWPCLGGSISHTQRRGCSFHTLRACARGEWGRRPWVVCRAAEGAAAAPRGAASQGGACFLVSAHCLNHAFMPVQVGRDVALRWSGR
jgi:hypothetical protein